MKKRKILSLLLSLCFLIGLLPTAALAADQTNDGAGIRIVQGDAYDSNTGIFQSRYRQSYLSAPAFHLLAPC